MTKAAGRASSDRMDLGKTRVPRQRQLQGGGLLAGRRQGGQSCPVSPRMKGRWCWVAAGFVCNRTNECADGSDKLIEWAPLACRRSVLSVVPSLGARPACTRRHAGAQAR